MERKRVQLLKNNKNSPAAYVGKAVRERQNKPGVQRAQ
jgi:hypothetical protein